MKPQLTPVTRAGQAPKQTSSANRLSDRFPSMRGPSAALTMCHTDSECGESCDVVGGGASFHRMAESPLSRYANREVALRHRGNTVCYGPIAYRYVRP